MTDQSLITGGKVLTPAGFRHGVDVLVADGHIVSVGPPPHGFTGETLDVAGAWVVPGLIETHLHGAFEHDVLDDGLENPPEAGAIPAISRHLLRQGITTWLPTTVACEAAVLDRVLGAVAKAQDMSTGGARVLGAHLESNFLATPYKGAQPEKWLREPNDAELRGVIERHRAVIRVVTLAPELPEALDLIRTLVGWGITVAVGHTNATYDQVLAAIAAGATRVTHLCNAQRGFHHREPGTLGAGLTCDSLFTEIIADTHHVHPAGLKIAHRCKPAGRLMLVTDALRGTGLPPGRYDLGGQETLLDGQMARLADGTIAGSTATLPACIQNMVAHAGASPDAAFAMAGAAPAESLGLTDRGVIAPGKRADIAIFTPDYACTATMVGGAWVFRA